jgi:hypothetical protein
MSFWKDKSLWIYEAGTAVVFLIIAVVVFVVKHDFLNSLVSFVKLIVLAQPILLGAHFLDTKYRRRSSSDLQE